MALTEFMNMKLTDRIAHLEQHLSILLAQVPMTELAECELDGEIEKTIEELEELKARRRRTE